MTANPDEPEIPSVAAAFDRVVAEDPEAEALRTARRRFSYGDLARWSDAVAAEIAARRPPRDVPVAIVTPDATTLVPAALGAIRAGHFFVMVDAADPAERARAVIRQSRASICVADAGAADAAAALLGVPPVVVPDAPPPGAVARPEAEPNPLVHIVYTSGTTGEPKAIATPQRRFVREAPLIGARIGTVRGERVSYIAVPGFLRASGMIFGTLLNGGTLCEFDARRENLNALADFIRRERITVLILTPSLFRGLAALRPEGLDSSDVRRLNVSADVLTAADVEAFRALFPRGCALAAGFASSETGMVFRMNLDHDTPLDGPLVPLGTAWPDVEVRLVDEEGREVAAGEPGEMIVTSPWVIEGYWTGEGHHGAGFSADPQRPGLRSFASGDLVKLRPDGLYSFCGRKDGRLKIHGRRIDPVEVESALLSAGPLQAAVVVGRADASGTQHLTAYVVPSPGAAVDASSLRAAMRSKVPAWMIPARIVEIGQLPFTRGGKVDRAALAARHEEPHVEESGAADPLEEQLAGIWSRVTGRPVRVDDDFFDDLGGESVLAAHLVAAVEKELGRRIPTSLIVELKSVRNMARFLRSSTPNDATAVPLQQGTGTPLFVVSAILGSLVSFRNLGRAVGPQQTVVGLTNEGFDLDSFPQSQDEIVAAFAAAIRSVQPHGPYYLTGHSWGGTTAFQLARYFELSGEPVGLVAPIDTPAPGARRISLARRLLREAGNPLRAVKAFLRRRENRSMFKSYEDRNNRTRNIAMRTSMLAGTWTMGKYSGPVTVIRARDGAGRFLADRDLGWSQYAPGPVRVVEVPGDHLDVVSGARVELGRALAPLLAVEER